MNNLFGACAWIYSNDSCPNNVLLFIFNLILSIESVVQQLEILSGIFWPGKFIQFQINLYMYCTCSIDIFLFDICSRATFSQRDVLKTKKSRISVENEKVHRQCTREFFLYKVQSLFSIYDCIRFVLPRNKTTLMRNIRGQILITSVVRVCL